MIDASTVPALRAWLAACPVSADDFAELAVDQPVRGVLLGVARVSEQGGALLAAVRTSAVGTLNNNRPTELRLDPTAVDVQLALRTTPGAAKRVLAESGTLVRRFPATLAALYAGDISSEHARALVDATSTVKDDEAARAIEAQVLPLMPGQAPHQTRKALRSLVEAMDADTADKRHQAANVTRRVEFRPEKDGMASVSYTHLTLPTKA